MLVDADRIAMSEAEKLGDAVRVKQMVNVYLAPHGLKITTGIRSVRLAR